jgi:hypothetical protein
MSFVPVLTSSGQMTHGNVRIASMMNTIRVTQKMIGFVITENEKPRKNYSPYYGEV